MIFINYLGLLKSGLSLVSWWILFNVIKGIVRVNFVILKNNVWNLLLRCFLSGSIGVLGGVVFCCCVMIVICFFMFLMICLLGGDILVMICLWGFFVIGFFIICFLIIGGVMIGVILGILMVVCLSNFVVCVVVFVGFLIFCSKLLRYFFIIFFLVNGVFLFIISCYCLMYLIIFDM